MNKKNVAVIFGGVSNEYKVSLRSARSVIDNIDKNIFNIFAVGITQEGKWLLSDGNVENISNDSWYEGATPAFISPDPTVGGLMVYGTEGIKYIKIDVIFPVMHGQNCEDGAIQGLLTLAKIPYVGCNITSSAICFDKEYTHLIAESASIPTARYIVAKKGNSIDEISKKITDSFGYPAFAKPARSGSSVGTAAIKTESDLKTALSTAFLEDDKVIIEEHITAQEIECAVYGNKKLIAPTTGEIVSLDGFYDYDSKYTNNSAKLLIPANIPTETQEQVKNLAKKIFSTFGCSGLSRVDFFVKNDGTILFNEINTLPGFTSISMYPKMMCQSTFSYPELITGLLTLAMEE